VVEVVVDVEVVVVVSSCCKDVWVDSSRTTSKRLRAFREEQAITFY
jgi:hypothetical protein